MPRLRRDSTGKQRSENLIGDVYAKKVYEHPLVKNLSKDSKLPSYIAPETLSAVLLEVIAKESNGKSYVAYTAQEAKTLVGNISDDHPLKDILGALIDDGEDAANALKDRLAGWFDEGMSRVAGWYKRQAKVIIFAIAGTVTVATNATIFAPITTRLKSTVMIPRRRLKRTIRTKRRSIGDASSVSVFQRRNPQARRP